MRKSDMRTTERVNADHLALIRKCVLTLPLGVVRVLYKCILAAFVSSAKKSQRSATNVGADIHSCETLSSEEYLQTINTLGSQWERATKKSRHARHNLRCLDETTILGKLRASIPLYATGGFDHAISSIDSGNGHSDETLNFENAIEDVNQIFPAVSEPESTPQPEPELETEGIPVEPMGRISKDEIPTAPAKVVNYLVF